VERGRARRLLTGGGRALAALSDDLHLHLN
jgi:hypothetical protein